MNRELTVQEAALAWVQGKRVEAARPSSAWGLIQPVGLSEGMWKPGVLGGDSGFFRFRLAHEPAAKRYRPYTRLELIGVWRSRPVICKKRVLTALIIGVLEECVHIGNSHYTFAELLNEFDWSDGSPCGVEVES